MKPFFARRKPEGADYDLGHEGEEDGATPAAASPKQRAQQQQQQKAQPGYPVWQGADGEDEATPLPVASRCACLTSVNWFRATSSA